MAHAGGRPLKFETVEELQKKVDDYFEVTPKDEWTITGLAMHLDTFRKVLCEYGEKDEYSNTIKQAKQKVENGYEVDLKKAGRSGTIFALKNFGWRDQQYQDLTSNGNNLIPQPLLLNVHRNNSTTSGVSNEETNKSVSGWNVSIEND